MNPGILQNENEDEFGKLVFGQFQTGLKSGNSVQTVLNKIAWGPTHTPRPGPGPESWAQALGGGGWFVCFCKILSTTHHVLSTDLWNWLGYIFKLDRNLKPQNDGSLRPQTDPFQQISTYIYI